ncbi:MAG: HIT domain-containing protein [Propionibacteriaceae bacterium]|jgi:histidine triad (HIT) family protein|nr:HIT domain-containing protein [Propionibacteriaceae bacterium]
MSDDCLFCRIVAGQIPSRQVWSDDQAVAFLDIGPWQRGHCLVVPRRHLVDGTSQADAWREVADGLTAVARLVRQRLGAAGVNFLSNAGAVAGQEVFHFHVHVIPRYEDNPGMSGLVRRDPTAAQDLDGLWAHLTALE